jgi:two-component system, NtrC family, sensor histidine kinase KinB
VNNGPFDIGGLLRGAAVAFRPLSDKHTLAVEVPDQLPKAIGDPTATDIIVGQLLENAYKYSPDGGKVTVRAKKDGDKIQVLIEDEGVGIPAADRERIFERFVQGEAGDRRRFGGIGLGLYIVRQLAREQGGEVVADEAKGGGTIMRLELRLAGKADQEAAAPPAVPADKAAADKAAKVGQVQV